MPTVMPTFTHFSFSNEIHPYRISFLYEFSASCSVEKEKKLKSILRILRFVPLCTFPSFYSNSSRIFYIYRICESENIPKFRLPSDQKSEDHTFCIRKMKGEKSLQISRKKSKTFFFFRWIIALKM